MCHMAGIDIVKLHGGREVKRQLRHNDKNMRLNDNHKNKQINKALTSNNWQLSDGYNNTVDLYEKTLDDLDKKPDANIRHDRVTAMSFEIPRPKDLPSSLFHEWHQKVLDIYRSVYPDMVLLNSYEHVDEVHEYVHAETGQKTMSREHGHDIIMPIIDGKLNGKQFSSRRNIKLINQEIQKMTQQDYGCDFMDGSKKKSDKTVEELKNESTIKKLEQELQEKVQELNSKIADLSRDSYDEGYSEFLSHKKFKNGKTAKDLFDKCRAEYDKSLQVEIQDPVEQSVIIPVEETEEEQDLQPVAVPVRNRGNLPRRKKTYEEIKREVFTPATEESNDMEMGG